MEIDIVGIPKINMINSIDISYFHNLFSNILYIFFKEPYRYHFRNSNILL